MEMDKKKFIIPTIAAVLTLILLTAGATYAYFSVSTTNSFGTTTIEATADTVGSVALTGGSNLTLHVTAEQMMQGANDITYYASASGTTTTETSPVIATATVTGSGTYNCNYTLNIAASATSAANNMYTKFQNMSTMSTGQIVLTVGGTAYDFNTASLFPMTINGTLTAVSSGSPKTVTAQLKLVNKASINQDDLQGTDITLTFTATAFTCTATA